MINICNNRKKEMQFSQFSFVEMQFSQGSSETKLLRIST